MLQVLRVLQVLHGLQVLRVLQVLHVLQVLPDLRPATIDKLTIKVLVIGKWNVEHLSFP